MITLAQFIVVPLVSGMLSANLMPNFGVVENPKSEILNSKPNEIKLNLQSPIPITSAVKKPEITPEKSRYQEEQERLEKERVETLRQVQSQRSRDVLPRDSARTSEPSFETKRALVKEIAAKKGIDWRILEAVWQVETGKRWDSTVRSPAGARGPAQFMPGTFTKYSEDYDGDGATSIYDAQDSLAAAANLLKAGGLDRGDTRSALYSYNRANWYVAKVIKVADSIVE